MTLQSSHPFRSDYRVQPQFDNYEVKHTMSPVDFSGSGDRDDLQQVWIEFLNRNFRTDEEAAIFFNVDESSIRHWKSGRNGLNAKRLVHAARKFPSLRQMIFGGK